jgi:hypothetical protein
MPTFLIIIGVFLVVYALPVVMGYYALKRDHPYPAMLAFASTCLSPISFVIALWGVIAAATTPIKRNVGAVCPRCQSTDVETLYSQRNRVTLRSMGTLRMIWWTNAAVAVGFLILIGIAAAIAGTPMGKIGAVLVGGGIVILFIKAMRQTIRYYRTDKEDFFDHVCQQCGFEWEG